MLCWWLAQSYVTPAPAFLGATARTLLRFFVVAMVVDGALLSG